MKEHGHFKHVRSVLNFLDVSLLRVDLRVGGGCSVKVKDTSQTTNSRRRILKINLNSDFHCCIVFDIKFIVSSHDCGE